MISDKEILRTVLPNNQEKETEELDSDFLPPITHNKAVELYDKVILYLEQQKDNLNAKKEELKFINKLKKETLKQ
jgi:hypothetical protein